MATVKCHTCGKSITGNVISIHSDEGGEYHCSDCADSVLSSLVDLHFTPSQQGGQPSSQAIQKVMTENKSEIVKRTSAVHSEDTTSDIARALHIPVNVLILARILHTKVINHPLWDCRRSPHALFVDCIYIVSKHKKMKMTSRNIAQTTKDYFGVGTQPRPNEWCIDYAFIVDEVLD